MKRTVQFTILPTALSFLIVLSVACNGDNANISTSQTATPSNTQGNASSPVPKPSSSSTTVNSTEPGIQLTAVPSIGAGPDALESIAGTVSGVNPRECKVVIFARTNTWYVQPYIDSSATLINDDRTWRSDTHLGLQYAALLVKTAYKPPTTTGKLPPGGGMVLAVVNADAKQ